MQGLKELKPESETNIPRPKGAWGLRELSEGREKGILSVTQVHNHVLYFQVSTPAGLIILSYAQNQHDQCRLSC